MNILRLVLCSFSRSGLTSQFVLHFVHMLPWLPSCWSSLIQTNQPARPPLARVYQIVLRKGHDRSVDVWAIGILIYEMMCGKAPFQSDEHDPARIYTRILNKEPKFSSHHWKGAGWEVVDLIKCLLKKNPKERLGNGNRGIQEIMQHSWFRSINWTKLEKKGYQPYNKIAIANALDASNFAPMADDLPLEGAPCEDERFDFLLPEANNSYEKLGVAAAVESNGNDSHTHPPSMSVNEM